ncbi:phosphoglycolate phosphatase [Sphingobium quisquiliarum P25]|uniref:Phosphoglycolate phosphatase n=1 Tax=Sphingobium quisquiliarum P25 TaxID=1329909 RepID=T0HB17_9SPHN|nr:HAD-IA family hydrolase [Sphingobium quisquiliarum]EQB09308.1 phosphoglycolate phosphatase [Sphingobium quisquiliarum P25]
MSRIPFDVVGFDLDGTLLDTSGDLAAAVNYALATIDRPPFAVEAIQPFVGKGAKVMLQRALTSSGGYDDELIATTLPVLLDYYEQNLAIHSVPYPGLIAAMDQLDQAGVKLAICTNKSKRFTIPLMHQIGLSDRFASIVCGDTLHVSKPDPAPILEMVARAGGGRAIFLGDTINDIAGARNAAIPSIAVSFGFLDGPVENLEADAVIHHFDELLPLLESWPSSC